jgi:hypothetical protein
LPEEDTTMNTKPTVSKPADPTTVAPTAKPPRTRLLFWFLFQGMNAELVVLAVVLFVQHLSF